MKRLAFAALMAIGVTASAAAQGTGQPLEPVAQPTQPPRTSSEAGPVSLADDDAGHAAFKAIDTNGDGRINRVEASVIEGFDFEKADTNSDASLNRPEYLVAMAATDPEDDGAVHALADSVTDVSFETADKNKDGRLNRTEASDVPGLDFAAADTNEDASLSRAEYRSALADAHPRG